MHLQTKRIAVASLVFRSVYSQASVCTFTEYIPSCKPELSAAPPAFLQTCGGFVFDGNGTFPSTPRAGGLSSGAVSAGASGMNHLLQFSKKAHRHSNKWWRS